jgi:hypothetical protein
MDYFVILEDFNKARAGLVARKVAVKDKGGVHQAIRWLRPGEDVPTPRKKKPEAPKAPKAVKPKVDVKEKLNIHGKEMRVTAVGQHGATLRDKEGIKHVILHEHIKKEHKDTGLTIRKETQEKAKEMKTKEPKEQARALPKEQARSSPKEKEPGEVKAKETKEPKEAKEKRPSDIKRIAKTEGKEIVESLAKTMKIFKQSEGMCGPASIRIAVSGLGKSFAMLGGEEEVAKLAGTTAEEGTSHDGIIGALRKAGINPMEYHNLSKEHSIEVLRNYTKKGNPIIVDWMKTKLQRGGDVKASEGMKPGEETAKNKADIRNEENEHYSVVQKVDDKNVYLLDPLEKSVEKLPIDYFLDRWFTMSEKHVRWFCILEEGKEGKKE